MYSREYNGSAYTLEASGGLVNASLIMQDRETDSHWSIMSGDAISGKLKGTRLDELPSEKMQWKNWVAKHPNSLVLSIAGRENVSVNHYDDYFNSPKGFRNLSAADERLPTKAPIFAFKLDGVSYAVPMRDTREGIVFKAGGKNIFLYRPKSADIFHSTTAYISTMGSFEKKGGTWEHTGSGCQFNTMAGTFSGSNCPERLSGFDTFWYNWSLINQNTELLTK